MLLETGEVTKIRDERAEIRIKRSSACSSCASRGVCLTFGTNERTVEVIDPVGAVPGDVVEIGIKPARVVWASTVAYIMPVAAMILGAAVGAGFAPEGWTDQGAALAAFLALGLSLGGIWLAGKIRGSRDDQYPVIQRVVRRGRDRSNPAEPSECDEVER